MRSSIASRLSKFGAQRETRFSISSGLLLKAAIGVRALIETVCKEQNASVQIMFLLKLTLCISELLSKFTAKRASDLELRSLGSQPFGNEASARFVKLHQQ